MPAPTNPQLRFLLRASGLFVAMLTVWWWLLVSPMLAGLRLTTSAILWLMPGGRSASGVTLQPDGDWAVRVPLPEFLVSQQAIQRAYSRVMGAPKPVNVRSFRLAIADRVPTFFTLGFPLFWALAVAGPLSRRVWRVLAIGTALLAVLTQLSLLIYIAYAIETTLQLVTSGLAAGLWRAVEYLNVNVVPYVAPLLLAAWLHRDLRQQIFAWGEPASAPESKPQVDPQKHRRGRYRG